MIAGADSRPEFASLIATEPPFAHRGDDSLPNRWNGWFDRLMRQSGMTVPPSLMVWLCACVGISIAGFVFVLTENFLLTAITVPAATFAPLLAAWHARRNRKRQLMRQLPELLGEIASAISMSRSVESALRTMADETSGALRTELKICTRQLSIGITPGETIYSLAERTGFSELYLLAGGLGLQESSGVDIAPLLERIQERVQQNALTSEALRSDRVLPWLAAAVTLAVFATLLAY